MQVTFAEKPQLKKKSLMKQKHGYLIHTSSFTASKGTVVNRALPSLHGGSLEIALKFPTGYEILRLRKCKQQFYI